ncbi:MAG: AAA domain-containing protein [Acholeplasmataceae bacterium]
MRTVDILSKAIKEARWLSIEYLNQANDVTHYWCAIKRIIPNEKRLIVDTFNLAMAEQENHGLLKDVSIYLSGIRSARVLDHTTYEQDPNLIAAIEAHPEDYAWLDFDRYNQNLVAYLKECIHLDSVPYHRKSVLIEGIDLEEIEKPPGGKYLLSARQIGIMAERIERLAKQDRYRGLQKTELAINELGIRTPRGLFVVAHRRLMFDPSARSLVPSPATTFNYEFLADKNDTFRHNLHNYLDIETDDFTATYQTDPERAKDMLAGVLPAQKERLDDRPYFIDIIRNQDQRVFENLDAIAEHKRKGTLSKPLNAFFGNMDTTKRGGKRKFDIVITDDRINVDQLRVIYNALKYPITYVQGPPGTGKTHSITNLLISAFFNGQTVLVSSNNNRPIDDILKKTRILKSRGHPIPLPILRLGNNESVLKTLDDLKRIRKAYQRFEAQDEKLMRIGLSNRNKMSGLNQIIEDYEKKLDLEEEIDVLKAMQESLDGEFNLSLRIASLLESKLTEYKRIERITDEDVHAHVVKAEKTFFKWAFFTSIKHLKRLNEPKYEQLRAIIDHGHTEERLRLFNRYVRDKERFKELLRIFPIVMTTNQSAYRLGDPDPLFDLVIIDEASQCSTGYALLPIMRGKRLLLVGDQSQLRPVITLARENNRKLIRKYGIPKAYDYSENSILRVMQQVDNVSNSILLRYHYRSHPDIINFSNKKYYQNQLKVPAARDLGRKALRHIDVDQRTTTRPNERNISEQEAMSIFEDIKARKLTDVGVITPFRNQASLLKRIAERMGLDNVSVGTVHTFQGDEKDHIYLTPAITRHSSPKTFDWLKNNEELINVATTRAKKEFVLVADRKEIARRSPEKNDLHELAQYVTHRGKRSDVPITPRARVSGFKQYNTKREKEMLETIKHVLSIDQRFFVSEKVKVNSILNRFTSPVKHDYGTKAEFDFVLFAKRGEDDVPVLVIELDGLEHWIDARTRHRDRLKEEICKENGLELIRIPNEYSRRYGYVKEVIRGLTQP